jgi:hypothetical protein
LPTFVAQSVMRSLLLLYSSAIFQITSFQLMNMSRALFIPVKVQLVVQLQLVEVEMDQVNPMATHFAHPALDRIRVPIQEVHEPEAAHRLAAAIGFESFAHVLTSVV